MDDTNDTSLIKVGTNLLDKIKSMWDMWLPLFMIEDKKILDNLVDRWLVEIKEIGNYRTPTAFITNDLTRLQAIADLMFPLS